MQQGSDHLKTCNRNKVHRLMLSHACKSNLHWERIRGKPLMRNGGGPRFGGFGQRSQNILSIEKKNKQEINSAPGVRCLMLMDNNDREKPEKEQKSRRRKSFVESRVEARTIRSRSFPTSRGLITVRRNGTLPINQQFLQTPPRRVLLPLLPVILCKRGGGEGA